MGRKGLGVRSTPPKCRQLALFTSTIQIPWEFEYEDKWQSPASRATGNTSNGQAYLQAAAPFQAALAWSGLINQKPSVKANIHAQLSWPWHAVHFTRCSVRLKDSVGGRTPHTDNWIEKTAAAAAGTTWRRQLVCGKPYQAPCRRADSNDFMGFSP
jgi:hypothetical protein